MPAKYLKPPFSPTIALLILLLWGCDNSGPRESLSRNGHTSKYNVSSRNDSIWVATWNSERDTKNPRNAAKAAWLAAWSQASSYPRWISGILDTAEAKKLRYDVRKRFFQVSNDSIARVAAQEYIDSASAVKDAEYKKDSIYYYVADSVWTRCWQIEYQNSIKSSMLLDADALADESKETEAWRLNLPSPEFVRKCNSLAREIGTSRREKIKGRKVIQEDFLVLPVCTSPKDPKFIALTVGASFRAPYGLIYKKRSPFSEGRINQAGILMGKRNSDGLWDTINCDPLAIRYRNNPFLGQHMIENGRIIKWDGSSWQPIKVAINTKIPFITTGEELQKIHDGQPYQGPNGGFFIKQPVHDSDDIRRTAKNSATPEHPRGIVE